MLEFGRRDSVAAVPTGNDVVPAASIIIKSRVLNSVTYEVLENATEDIICGDECCVFVLPIGMPDESRKLALLRKVLEDEAVCLDSKSKRIWRLHIDAVTVLTKMSQLGYTISGVTVEGLAGEFVHSWTLTAFDSKLVLHDDANNIDAVENFNETFTDDETDVATDVVNINEAEYEYLTESLTASGSMQHCFATANGPNHSVPLVEIEQENDGSNDAVCEEDDSPLSAEDDDSNTGGEEPDTTHHKAQFRMHPRNKNTGNNFKKLLSTSNGLHRAAGNTRFTASPTDAHATSAPGNSSSKTKLGNAILLYAAKDNRDLNLASVNPNNIIIDGADVVLGRDPTSILSKNRLSLLRVDELVSIHLVHGRWLPFLTSLLDELLLRNHDGCCYLTRNECGPHSVNVLPRNFVRSVYGLLLKAWQDVWIQNVQLLNIDAKQRPSAEAFCAAVSKYLKAHRMRCPTHAE